MFLNTEEFKKFNDHVRSKLNSLLIPIINGEPYNALDIAKEVDRIVYKYTGNEDLITSDKDDKDKVLFVEEQVEFFYTHKEKIRQLVMAHDSSINLSEIEILSGLFSQIMFSQIVGRDPDLFFKSMADPPEDSV
jgi:hypothetical protein